MIDLHSHILPGLDDGAQNLEESLEMARMAEKYGIEKIVATPHLFREGLIHEELGIIERKRDELSQVLWEKHVGVEVLAGAEVHISHNLIQEIRQNKRYLTLNKSSYMFVEFPSDHVFAGVRNLFFEVMSEGITPIIAHPERNSVFVKNPSLLYELIEMGALSQANGGSFSGLYGKRVEEAVLHFLELNLIHFIASDCHNSRTLAPWLSEAVMKAEMIIGKEKAQALVTDNPRAVLSDGNIPSFGNPIDPREKKSLRLKIPNIFWNKS